MSADDPTVEEELLALLSPTGEPTVEGELHAVLARLPAAATQIQEVSGHLFNAESIARADGRPTEELRRLAKDCDAIIELLQEKMMETIRHMAEEEAGSRG